MPYHAQVQQDEFLDRHLFDGLRGGVFVDIGANDGVSLSNSLFFEEERGWTGLLIEADPNVFAALVAARKATALNLGIGPRETTEPFLQIVGSGQMLSGFLAGIPPEAMARIERELATYGGEKRVIDLPMRPLSAVLAEAGLAEVQYLSLDVEGLEAEILATLDTKACFVHAITAECNDRGQAEALARAAGPDFALAAQHRHELFLVNRNSPYAANIGRLKRAVRGAAIRRFVDRIVNRGARKRAKAARLAGK